MTYPIIKKYTDLSDMSNMDTVNSKRKIIGGPEAKQGDEKTDWGVR